MLAAASFVKMVPGGQESSIIRQRESCCPVVRFICQIVIEAVIFLRRQYADRQVKKHARVSRAL
jgi:hypothetical protein